MTTRERRLLSAFVSLVLFLIAVWAIRKALGGHHPGEIFRSIMDVPSSHILWALLLIVVNYLLVAVMDTIAARFAGKQVSYFRMILPSFIGITFQYNAGFFGGGAMRFRLFSSLGLDPRQTGKMLLLFSLAFSIGFFLLTGLTLVFDPLEIYGRASWLPEVAGSLLLAGCLLYFWLCARGTSLRLLRWHFALPHLRASLLQTLLAIVDWVVEAGILYVLLPPQGRASFLVFMSIFMLAHNLGILSNTPGGLGVFEATVLSLLPSAASPSRMLGILLAYRGIYYVLPLLIATPLLGERVLANRLKRRSHEKRNDDMIS